jgi:hypothetical protein
MTRYQTKLQPGTVVQVHGWPMLGKLEDGQKYRIETSNYQGIPTYSFKRPKGKKTIVRHYVDDVDPWIRPDNHPDLNKIVILKPEDY